MHKYVVERTLPGAAELSAADLRAIAQRSNEMLDSMAGRAQWLESYVTDDKLYCVYIADGLDAISEHAEAGGFPCDGAREIHTMIDPTTATARAAASRD